MIRDNQPVQFVFAFPQLFKTTLLVLLLVCFSFTPFLHAGDQQTSSGNRLVYLDEDDPYYVSLSFPKLVTPQWVGDTNVKAVCVLAIDDMSKVDKYEKYLRPILNRLKEIDGRAGVSIMACQIDPKHPHLKKWIDEGVSIEVHTYDHPCPLLKDHDFQKAAGTVNRCIDLLNQIPKYKPVAYRMPCCDSLNTVSPRFFTEIFNKPTKQGNFLQIDTSVFQVFTSDDPALERKLIIDPNGLDKIKKYIPTDRGFVNTIFNYPYPYPISKLCWEFPCVTPSDWSAQHRQKPFHPLTVRDWASVLDATVAKEGTFNLVFHPHGWIRNDQVIKLIDHAIKQHGKSVQFLSFQEVLTKMNKNLLAGQPLRSSTGEDNGVKLIDLNNDGYLDVVIGNHQVQKTRIWNPQSLKWSESNFPTQIITKESASKKVATRGRFGIIDGEVVFFVLTEQEQNAWRFHDNRWVADKNLLNGLTGSGTQKILVLKNNIDQGVRLRDSNNDGTCELLISNPSSQQVFAWSKEQQKWLLQSWQLPKGTSIVTSAGKDNGLRFVDINEDGFDDVLFSNGKRNSLHLYQSMKTGWSDVVFQKKRTTDDSMPIIAKNGMNNGAWFHSRNLWVQNEGTAELPHLVQGKSFNELLQKHAPRPKSPAAGLQSIKVKSGFKVELVVAEPLVKDPIAFDWGTDGKLWVAEMADYPLGMDGKGSFGGRIRFLEDADGDGTYEKSTLFLDKIGFPTGVMAWKKGVLVTCAPDLFYAEDTNGDGKADVRQILFTGFQEGNQQHRLNSLRWGLDNWVYAANGDSGGIIHSLKTKTKMNLSGRDLRFHPETGAMETVSGQTQFGRVRDDWGNWFGCSNSQPSYHYVLKDHYLKRNKYLSSPNVKVQISNRPGAATVFPQSRTLARFNEFNKVNRFTSACGIEIYRDHLLGNRFQGNSFVCEPVHNLVHREIVTSNKSTFASQRPADEQHQEFLASSDNWFRPTMARTGPDGALWISDMYRAVIEHPQWIPKEFLEKNDVRAGDDKGRIYRVVPVGIKKRKILNLTKMTVQQQIELLESPNGTVRDMVHKQLLGQQTTAAIPTLKKMITQGKRATARLHALCILDGLKALTVNDVKSALKDEQAGVRRHAVRLSEQFMRQPNNFELPATLIHEKDARVRMQLAYSLGYSLQKNRGRLLAELLHQQPNDLYLQTAVMSSLTGQLQTFTTRLLQNHQQRPPSKTVMTTLINMVVSTKDQATLSQICLRISRQPKPGNSFSPSQIEMLSLLLDTLSRHNSSLSILSKNGTQPTRDAITSLRPLFVKARQVAINEKASLVNRQHALLLLGRGFDQREKDIKILIELMSPRQSQPLQRSTLNALAQFSDRKVGESLLARWKTFGPQLRTDLLDLLLRRQAWLEQLLDAIEQKKIRTSHIDATRRQILLLHKNQKIRQRAIKLFASAGETGRTIVVKRYSDALILKGDKFKGYLLFKKKCSICHRLNNEGYAIGPDLSALTDKSPKALLVSILDPNRAIERKFVSYVASTLGGLTFTGILTTESGNSITLLQNEGKKQTLLRSELDEFQSTNKSLMPEGFEKDISKQGIADIIAYLNGITSSRKKNAAP
ncbi:hypothetical protein MNBD_PLANCTO02-137 [hydrothermal vent metagenome]|uniref:Cytochrome c domain-containing protein n=2 Tax=hydrothermal vent metagenome TaxID=652676 RepID=A0A3B1D749_9ZZZZ